MNNNSPPLTFKRFQTIVSRLELPRRPLPAITQQQMDSCQRQIGDNHDQLYSIPSLEELGKPLNIFKVFFGGVDSFFFKGIYLQKTFRLQLMQNFCVLGLCRVK